MSALETSVQPNGSARSVGMTGWLKRRPLFAYFARAYAVTWILLFPILLSQRGFGWLALPDALLLVHFIVATFGGPLAADLVVTGVTEGRDGVRHLLGRIVQWRVGLVWYLIAILGYPLVFLVGYGFALGAAPFNAFMEKWPLFFATYLPAILVKMIVPGLGEEPGWRGFALPRLQLRFGTLAGTFILGSLHALCISPLTLSLAPSYPGPST